MFLNVNGVRLHTVAFGQGPRTLVATGGWTGSWELWQQPFELLTAAGWRCISFDHRGSGESPVAPDLITAQAMTEDVIGVLDAYGVERCVLAGESMGGAIAQLAAERHPSRFTGLVLVDPAEAVFNDRRAMLAAGARADYPATVQAFVDRCLPEPDSEHLKRWGRDILLRAEPEQAARLLEMWQDATGGDPSRISAPTLIVHGAVDAVVPVEHSRVLATLIPDVELVVIDGVGHVPTMTRPHDVVAAICQRFPAAD
ncbi:MAG TPA: alpha/beta hydrolase [Mycobacteriales bacterium]|nr:alpha/beta hydrolase [Mycobacteriales bacterium]